jgi:hypothetical protein
MTHDDNDWVMDENMDIRYIDPYITSDEENEKDEKSKESDQDL